MGNHPVNFNDPTGHKACGDGEADDCDGNPKNIPKSSTLVINSNGIVKLSDLNLHNDIVTPTNMPTLLPTLNPLLGQNFDVTPKPSIILEKISPTFTPVPTATPQPAGEFLQIAKEEGLPSIPSILGFPSTILDPGYSQAMVNSLSQMEIHLKLIIGVGVTNNPGIVDYLYNGQLVNQAVKGWLGLTNNNIVILPMPLPYLMNNPYLPPQYQYGPPQYQ